MARLVMKFGGTSVADVDRIRNLARHVQREVEAGYDIAVVVSAMSGKTNELVDWCRIASRFYDPREYDAVVAAGEQITAGLLAIVLQDMGIPARSWQGWQVPILTSDAHGSARIADIDGSAIFKGFEERKEVAVIAGFQGLHKETGRISTLGRGGSDTSAVAIAAAIKAERCDIYTDVDGVYTTDPNICPSARKIDRISYEEMLELASLGAKVLQIRSVEVAMKYGVPVHVRSSFSDRTGTMVVGEEGFESVAVAGVAYDKGEAKVQLVRMKDKPGVVAKIFGMLAEHNVSVDMIIQSPSRGGKDTTDVTFTVAKSDLPRAKELIEKTAAEYGSEPVEYDPDIVKVSIVGLGMRSHAGVAAKMFGILASEGINIQAISTSEIKISCIIAAKYTELAVRALHEGFGLDKAPVA